MDLKNFIILISIFINLFLGFFVLLNGKTKLANVFYSIVAFGVSLWSIGMFLYRFSNTVDGSIFWCKILYSAPIFIVCSFLFFCFTFTEEKIKKWLATLAIFASGLFFYFTLFTNEIVKNVTFIPNKEKFITFGNLYISYTIFISIFFLLSYIILLTKRRKSSGILKTQIDYIFGGAFSSSMISMTTNLLLPTFGIFLLNWVGQISSLIMVVFIAYAIVIHRLMDIKVVLRKSFVYTASIIVIVVPAIFISYFFDEIFPGYNIFINLVILIFAVSVFTSARNYFYRLGNKYFFASLYDSAEVITKFGEKLRSIIEIDKIYNLISETITNSLHSKGVGILNYEKETGKYKIEFNDGFDVKGQKIFPGDKKLHELFTRQSKIIVVEEIKGATYQDYKEIIDMLNKFGVALVVPLNIKDETLGVIVLGQKEAKDMYNTEDLRTLEIIASQAAISIKNAQLYEETRQFSQTLQKEVERQTSELKRANEELQILDKAKSKFISIASHQLRTPLTAIKGYVSLIREGTYGKPTKKMEHPLENVYLSNERLIRLVNDLLNVSRIEAGKIDVVREKASVEDIIASITEELQNIAKSKNLTVEWTKSEKALPKITVDVNKIRNAIFNIVDNAIRYTEKGGITISTAIGDPDSIEDSRQSRNGSLQIRVKDTGPGIEKKELEKLFNSFSRGAAGIENHTEGTGLGLYIAKSFVGMHNGKIWAESDGLGKGSTFVIELPIV